MKLNNKGFAITGILYGLLILFALLVGSYLTILTAKKNRLDGIVTSIEEEYNANSTYNGPFTVIITVLGSEESRETTSKDTFTATGVYTQGLTSISCTNGATATVSGETVTVTNITADTTCNIS